MSLLEGEEKIAIEDVKEEEEEEEKEEAEAVVAKVTAMVHKGLLEIHRDVKRRDEGGIEVQQEEEAMYYYDRH